MQNNAAQHSNHFRILSQAQQYFLELGVPEAPRGFFALSSQNRFASSGIDCRR